MRVCIIGTGAISGVHASALKSINAQIAAVCDVDAKKAYDFIRNNDIDCPVYEDYKEMLLKTRPDAVHILTPHYLHAEMALFALSENINVLSEKPVCINFDQLKALLNAAKQSKAQYGVCFQNRYLFANRKAYDFVSKSKVFGADGAVGPYVIIAVVFIAGFIVLKWTKVGRKIYAVGSNAEAARVSGINVDAVLIYTYVIMGFLSGLCGALSVSIYASAQPNMQYGLEMDIIASCVIGGVSMSGGRGSVAGTFLGALILALITRALPLVGIDAIAQNMVKGILILAVVVLNVVTQRMMDRANLERREM